MTTPIYTKTILESLWVSSPEFGIVAVISGDSTVPVLSNIFIREHIVACHNASLHKGDDDDHVSG